MRKVFTERYVGGKKIAFAGDTIHIIKEIRVLNYKADTIIELSHPFNYIPKGFIVLEGAEVEKAKSFDRRKIYVKYPQDADELYSKILIY